MTAECCAIILIILTIAAIMARRGKSGIAIAILPMTLPPVFYLISNSAAHFIDGLQEPDVFLAVRCVVLVVGSLLACLIMGFFASKVRSGAARKVYLFLCGGFTLAFTAVMLIKIIP